MVGYSGTLLIKKLGIKEGFKIAIVNAPNNYFTELVELPNDATFASDEMNLDFVYLFTNQFDELEQLLVQYQRMIVPKGMIWVSWCKKAAKLPTEITEDVVRGTALTLICQMYIQDPTCTYSRRTGPAV